MRERKTEKLRRDRESKWKMSSEENERFLNLAMRRIG